MPTYKLLRVFCAAGGTGGNPLAVFLDGASIGAEDRQATAARLGYSETVFVDDAAEGVVRIYTPARELPFAGHPLVGTSWLLRVEGPGVDVLRPPAGEVPTWRDGELTWIRARAEWVHDIDLDRLASAADVEALLGPPEGRESYYPWAWIDEAAGTVRSRYFVKEFGIDEDEATGAAAVVLGNRIGRPITIHQGRGSELRARPGPAGTIEVGGRCAGLEEREALN
jgi:predicted PhzF superfamily epimerase YddE/YHI9